MAGSLPHPVQFQGEVDRGIFIPVSLGKDDCAPLSSLQVRLQGPSCQAQEKGGEG